VVVSEHAGGAPSPSARQHHRSSRRRPGTRQTLRPLNRHCLPSTSPWPPARHAQPIAAHPVRASADCRQRRHQLPARVLAVARRLLEALDRRGHGGVHVHPALQPVCRHAATQRVALDLLPGQSLALRRRGAAERGAVRAWRGGGSGRRAGQDAQLQQHAGLVAGCRSTTTWEQAAGGAAGRQGSEAHLQLRLGDGRLGERQALHHATCTGPSGGRSAGPGLAQRQLAARARSRAGAQSLPAGHLAGRAGQPPGRPGESLHCNAARCIHLGERCCRNAGEQPALQQQPLPGPGSSKLRACAPGSTAADIPCCAPCCLTSSSVKSPLASFLSQQQQQRPREHELDGAQ
jgi:hypothetical protein